MRKGQTREGFAVLVYCGGTEKGGVHNALSLEKGAVFRHGTFMLWKSLIFTGKKTLSRVRLVTLSRRGVETNGVVG